MADIKSTSAEIKTQDSALRDIKNPYNALVSDIAGMPESVESTSSLENCIYRVPMIVRKINEEAYTPRAVSIGPFHHGSERLKSMEAHKSSYFKKFIRRGNKRLDDYVGLMKDMEEKTRHCYAETISWLDSDEFVKMILVDAGFIIELLLRCNFDDCLEKNEPILSKPWLRDDLEHDLILLENQLPLFVLEEFFNLTFAPFTDNSPSLLPLTLKFLWSYNSQNKDPNFRARHFTDFVRTLHLPTSRRLPENVGEKFKFLHSATELHEAGVKFKVGSSKCLLDIHFSNEVLEIPCFELYDDTIPVIRNLMALEQCHYRHVCYITDYIVLMDNLINTPKDIDLLVKEGILVNGLGDSGAAATFFNNLCTHITYFPSNFYFSSLCEELNTYYKVTWHKWKTTFKRDYFSTPWRTASTIAAVILLVLTFAQTVLSGLSMRKGV